MTTAAFLRHAGRSGAPVAVAPAPLSLFPAEMAVRRVDAADTATLDDLFRTVAAAWDFPEYFGAGKDAFDDCMRDLPPRLRTATGAPARGYVTVIERAVELLSSASDEDLAWLATSLVFYRDHYRDEVQPPRGFAVVLRCTEAEVEELRDRWAAAGVTPVVVRDRTGA